jgi:DeoR family fructose operon transcriptional repressor
MIRASGCDDYHSTHHRRGRILTPGEITSHSGSGCGSVQTKQGDERRRLILDHARGSGYIEVTEVALRLDVAAETVRRDLKVLEEHGLVRRIHGGAYPVDGAGFETNMAHRSGHLVPEKRRIAAAAAQNLGDAETVYLDEGFTPQLVAEEIIKLHRPLTVVTSALTVAGMLAPVDGLSVILLGGRVRGRTLATLDHWAIAMLADLVIDVAILGTNGISRDRGLTTPEPAVSAVKKKVVEVSRRRMFVGVHTKFGVNSFCKFADVADFETLITDSGLSTFDAHRYTAIGPSVIRV